jgi:hypothetical protein
MRLLLILAVAALSGCAILPRNAVPVDRMDEAVVPGMPDIRESSKSTMAASFSRRPSTHGRSSMGSS